MRDPVESPPLVFAVGPSVSRDDQAPLREQLGWLLTGATGRDVEVVAYDTYAALREVAEGGKVDVAWLPPVLYVELEARSAVRLLLASVRAQGASFYSAVFVRHDADIVEPAQLRGRRIAWVDHDSCAGYLFPRLALQRMGFNVPGSFASEELCGSHAAVVDAVDSGRVDAGATYVSWADVPFESAAVRAGWLDRKSRTAMRVILSPGPIPSDVIVASASLEPAVAADVTRALSLLHRHAKGGALLSRAFGVDWFEPALPGRFDAVRAAMSAPR